MPRIPPGAGVAGIERITRVHAHGGDEHGQARGGRAFCACRGPRARPGPFNFCGQIAGDTPWTSSWRGGAGRFRRTRVSEEARRVSGGPRPPPGTRPAPCKSGKGPSAARTGRSPRDRRRPAGWQIKHAAVAAGRDDGLAWIGGDALAMPSRDANAGVSGMGEGRAIFSVAAKGSGGRYNGTRSKLPRAASRDGARTPRPRHGASPHGSPRARSKRTLAAPVSPVSNRNQYVSILASTFPTCPVPAGPEAAGPGRAHRVRREPPPLTWGRYGMGAGLTSSALSCYCRAVGVRKSYKNLL